MKPSTKTKALCIVGGMLVGGLLVGGFCFLQSLKIEHHYRELETFFRGSVAGKEVLGISYFDYHGIGFMESNQWRIQLQDSNGQSIVVYQNRPTFQEAIPYQPEIKIEGEKILIDDGENNLTIAVNK